MKKIIFKNNILYLFVFLFCCFIFLYSLNENYGIIRVFFRYFTDHLTQKQFLLDSDLINNLTQSYGPLWAYRMEMSQYVRDVEGLFTWGAQLFQMLIPLIASVTAFLVFRYNETIYKFQYLREKETYKTFLLKKSFYEALKLASATYFAYLCFWTFNYFIHTPFQQILPEQARYILTDIFGIGLYVNHIFIYFLLEGLVRFFIIPFIYSFFANACAFLVNKSWKAFLIPNIYFFVLTLIGYIFLSMEGIVGKIALYIAPAILMGSGDYANFSSLLMIAVNCIPFIIGLALLMKVSHEHEIA